MSDVNIAVQGDSYDKWCVPHCTASHRLPGEAQCNEGYDQQRNCSVGKTLVHKSEFKNRTISIKCY